jgi:hypothetical protein
MKNPRNYLSALIREAEELANIIAKSTAAARKE